MRWGLIPPEFTSADLTTTVALLVPPISHLELFSTEISPFLPKFLHIIITNFPIIYYHPQKGFKNCWSEMLNQIVLISAGFHLRWPHYCCPIMTLSTPLLPTITQLLSVFNLKFGTYKSAYLKQVLNNQENTKHEAQAN